MYNMYTLIYACYNIWMGRYMSRFCFVLSQQHSDWHTIFKQMGNTLIQWIGEVERVKRLYITFLDDCYTITCVEHNCREFAWNSCSNSKHFRYEMFVHSLKFIEANEKEIVLYLKKCPQKIKTLPGLNTLKRLKLNTKTNLKSNNQ